MRRVVLTPTFAAGLGFVIATVIAYPLATRFRYDLFPGTPCQVRNCGVDASPPAEASAKAASPLQTGPTATPSPQVPSEGQTGPGGSSPPQARQTVLYETLQQGHSFLATLVVAPVAAGSSQAWRLQVTYPSARITGVWGGQVLSLKAHALVVGPLSGGKARRRLGITIAIRVTGQPTLPATCVFDGQACDVVVSPGGYGGRGGYASSGSYGGQAGTSGNGGNGG